MCRKAAEAPEDSEIEVWGDGLQTRSFLYVDECVEAVIRLMKSDFLGPVNIGSEEMVSINELAQMAIDLSGKNIKIKILTARNLLTSMVLNVRQALEEEIQTINYTKKNWLGSFRTAKSRYGENFCMDK